MKTIKYFIVLIVSLASMSSCMDLQGSYDYEPKNIDNQVNMTTWEFIESRQDLFSDLKRAIIHAELEPIFTRSEGKYTYLLLKNAAFRGTQGIVASSGVATIEDMDKNVLKEILLYHTIDGNYHGLGTLGFDPVFVITLSKAENTYMTLKLSNSTGLDYYSRLYVNEMAGNSVTKSAVTSNIFTTNGVVHIFDSQIIYLP